MVMDLQRCAAALKGAQDTVELKACIAELAICLAEYVRPKARQNSKAADELLSAVKLMLAKLDHAAGHLDQLLQLTDGCLACCKRTISSSKHVDAYRVIVYSYIKKLVGLKRFSAALEHGQQLLADLQHLDEASDQSTQDLLLGAALNVIICTCKLDQPVLPALCSVSTAARSLSYVLRLRSGPQAAQHAGIVCRYLLELLGAAAAEVPQDNSDRSSSCNNAADNITQLLVHIWEAAGMCQQQAVFQQVVLRAVDVLPGGLKHCSIVAMLQAAGLQPVAATSSSSSSLASLGPTMVLLGLQKVLAAATNNAAVAAACVRGLTSVSQTHGLCTEGCMLLLALAARSYDLLAARELEAISAAVTNCLQTPSTTVDAEQRVDELAGQLSKVSISKAAGKKRTAGSSNSRGSSKNDIHDEPAPMEAPAYSEVQLEVGAMCLQQLLKTQPQGAQLALPCIALAEHVASMMQAQQEQRGQCSIPWQLAAQALALAASLLTQSSCSEQHQLLQRVSGSVRQLIDVPRLYNHALGVEGQQSESAKSHSSWSCPLSCSELQWLSWQLYNAAIKAGISGDGESATDSSISQTQWMAADLLLLGWQCSCACLTMASEQQQQEVGTVEAVTELLQQAQAYLGHLWRAEQSETLLDSTAPAGNRLQQPNDVQRLIAVTVVAAVQHMQQQEKATGKVERHLEKVMGLLSKLHCKQAVSPSSRPGSEDTDSRNSGRGSGKSNSSKHSKGQSAEKVVQQQAWPSVVQLILQNCCSSRQVLLDVICWLECKSLLKVASNARLAPGAAEASITALIQQLSACDVPAECDAAVFDVQRQLVLGMMLAISPSSSSDLTPAAALSAACEATMVLLNQYQDSSPPTAAAARGSSRTKGRPISKQRSRKQAQPVAEDSASITEAAQVVASTVGYAAAAQLLAAAALSSCLLGLAAVAAVMQQQQRQQSPADEATVEAFDGEQTMDDGCQFVEDAVKNNSNSSSINGTCGAIGLADAAGWAKVYQHWQTSSQLFQQLVQLHGNCNRASMMQAIRFPAEAAIAISEAWHVASLQGWSQCQPGFAVALQVVAQLLPPQQREQLQPIQQIAAVAPVTGWLGVLVAPQRIANHLETTSSSSSEGSRSGPAESSNRRQRGKAAILEAARSHRLCSCVLLEEQQHLLDTIQQYQQEAEVDQSSMQQLQHAHMLLAAGQASIAADDAVTAVSHAEAALELSKAVMSGVSSSRAYPVPCLQQSSSKHMTDGSLYWHALALYMSALWQLAELFELAGNPDDAIRVLKELFRISSTCHCTCMAALAQATISSIHSKMGNADKAQSAAAAAAEWLEQYQQLSHQQVQDDLVPGQLLGAVTAATVGQAQAANCLAACQYKAAEEALRVQLETLHEAVGQAVAAQCQLQDSSPPNSSPPHMLTWKAVALRAQLQLQLSHVLVQTAGPAEALECLTAALADLEGAGSCCSRCCKTAWPAAHAALRLQQLLWSPPSGIACQPYSRQTLQLVGFSSSSSHANLQAEFACAAADNSDSQPHNSDNAADEATPAPSRGRKVRNSKNRPSCSTSSHSSSGGTTAASVPSAQTPAAWLSEVLSLLPACVHDTLLMKGVCSCLSSVLQACGAVSAAALLLQLALGLSVSQQQLMTVSSKLSRAQRRSSKAATSADEPPQDHKNRVWQQLQQQLDLKPLLTELAAVAEHSQQSSSDSGVLTGMLTRLGDVAQQWLQQQLIQLQPGTVACSMSANCAALNSSTADNAALHLPVLLPAAAAVSADQAGSSSLLVCRMGAAAARGATPGQQMPLIVHLQPPSGGSIHDVLSELSSILSDSTSSMKASEGLSSNTPAAAKWWKQRVALDSRMAALLKQLDQEWLGPWRCLVMQPGQQQQELAAGQKAQEFVSEHFDFVFEEVPRQLLTQLVSTLLVHLDACSTSELQRAMRDICQLTQHRVDGLHISKLVADLTELHGPVKAAAALIADSTTGTTPHRRSKAVLPSSSKKAAISGPTEDSAPTAEYATPAAPRARSRLALMQTSVSAKKAPQSRLKAMQKSSSNSSSNALADDVGSLASLMVRKLQLEEQQQQEEGDSGHVPEQGVVTAGPPPPAPEPKRRAKAPGTTVRRVRFAQPDDNDLDKENATDNADPERQQQLLPPPSVARHGVRRSRLQGSMQGSNTNSSNATPAATFAAPASVSDEESNQPPATPAACKPPRSRLSSIVTAAEQEEQQQGGVWLPSVLLLLDGDVQQLPWESCAGLKQQSIYRCPGLSVAAAAAVRSRLSQPSSSSRPSMCQVATSSSGVPRALQLSSGFFLLNPDGDLAATQNTFEGWLQQQLGLEGVSGCRPTSSQLVSALQQHDLFLYFGHGGGEQYVPLSALKRLDRCAGSLLMGCSSGRLKQSGVYEASGAIWGYLMAGCPAAVANLWDVTDRDIDRFAQSVLQQWAGNSTKDEAGVTSSRTSSKHASVGSGSVDSANDQGPGVKMCAAVAAARQACRLPHLIGAAAVCYGLPTFVGGAGSCQ